MEDSGIIKDEADLLSKEVFLDDKIDFKPDEDLPPDDSSIFDQIYRDPFSEDNYFINNYDFPPMDHRNMADVNKPDIIKCEHCGEEYFESDYIDHTRKKHPALIRQMPPYRCPYCTQNYFYTNHDLLKHYQVCMDSKRPSYWEDSPLNEPFQAMRLKVYCPIPACGKLCSTFFYLSVHIQNHQVKGDYFRCTACNTQFKNAFHLKDHLINGSKVEKSRRRCFNTPSILEKSEAERKAVKPKQKMLFPVKVLSAGHGHPRYDAGPSYSRTSAVPGIKAEKIHQEGLTRTMEIEWPGVSSSSDDFKYGFAETDEERKERQQQEEYMNDIEDELEQGLNMTTQAYRAPHKCPWCLEMQDGCDGLDAHCQTDHMDQSSRLQYGCSGCGIRYGNAGELRMHLVTQYSRHRRLCVNSAVVFVKLKVGGMKLADYLAQSERKEPVPTSLYGIKGQKTNSYALHVKRRKL